MGSDPAVAVAIDAAIAKIKVARRSGAAWGHLALLLMHCEFAEAELAFEHAQRFSPREPRWLFLHGTSLMNRDPHRALILLRRAAELAGGEPDIVPLRLAQYEFERGNIAQAENGFARLLELNPNHPLALLGLARIRYHQNRLEECQQILGSCLTNLYTGRRAHDLLSNVQLASGNLEMAMSTARRGAAVAVDLPWPDPIGSEAALWRVGRKLMIDDATLLLDQERLEDALTILAKVVRDYPDEPDGWYLSGWALNRSQRSPEAESALRQHLRLLPASARGYAQLAVSLLAQQRFPEAIEVLQKAIQLKPGWRELHANLGYARVVLGREEEALLSYRQAVSCDPNHVPSQASLAELLLRRGERQEALRVLRRASELDPEDVRVQRLIASAGDGL